MKNVQMNKENLFNNVPVNGVIDGLGAADYLITLPVRRMVNRLIEKRLF
ncbi:hypothetical protein ACFYKT_13755 [Cytobacillus sp. FJAT-53684]|uniref:Uncharacterized protein n=1 Tax=Cytobacillus mangrovibacter TaxID=3299024 RepID=A0ABW6K3C8_9BACI